MKIIDSSQEFANCIQGRTIYVKPDVTTLSRRKMERLARIAELQRYYQRNPVKFVSDFLNVELLDYQKWIFQNSWICPNVLLVLTRGAGKALGEETPINTPEGRKRFGDLKVGDQVFDGKGKPCTVLALSETFYNKCFEVEFSDHEKIICNEDHLWNVYTPTDHPEIMQTHDARWMYQYYQTHKQRLSVPSSPAVEYPKQDLPIDPYVLGVWLGDGSKSNGWITTSQDDVDELCSLIESRGYVIHTVSKRDNGCCTVNIHCPDGTPLITKLKQMDLPEEKHIPDIYLKSSIEDRMLLLQGLMDTDGCISKKADCEFAQNNIDHARLGIDFGELLVSLGIRYSNRCNKRTYTHNNEKKESTAMRFFFKADIRKPVFRLKRKAERLSQTPLKSLDRKYIQSVKEVDPVPTHCICVDSPDHLFLCGRKNTVTHNSFLIDLLLMAKGMLFNNYWTYIASGSGAQAQQTFMTLEKLANDNIDTLVGSTGYIFKNEVMIPNANGDGFSHSSDGWRYTLNNGSMSQTLNSNIDAKRGFRGNVVFDETGWLSAEMLQTYAAFAVVNKEFKTGKAADGRALDRSRIKALPKDLPNQLFYISSASSTDTEFYRLFQYFSKRMLIGDPNYFVAMLDCHIAFEPTMNGEVVSALLSRETVENAMQTNPEKARREYFCQFTTDAGDNAVLRRGLIARNSETRKPLLYNDTGDKKFVIVYDPARLSDNSVIGVAEIYQNSRGEKEARIVNCINLVNIHKRNKTPITIPNQIAILRQTILDYNGDGNEFYSNILGIYIDAGAGGQASAIADTLMEDWVDKDGFAHRGLVDLEYDGGIGKNFPNAVRDVLHIVKPSEYKSIMFENLIEMANGNHIKFTADYDNKGYLAVIRQEDAKYQKEKDKLIASLKSSGLSDEELDFQARQMLAERHDIQTDRIPLDPEEEIALANIDLMKEQIVNMTRIKRESGRDGFELVPEKRNTYHDDAAYCLAMIGYALSLIRHEDRKAKKRKPKQNIGDLLAGMTKKAVINKAI